MDLIATAVHDSGLALDNPFTWLIVVSAVAVTASIAALLGAFALVMTGRAE